MADAVTGTSTSPLADLYGANTQPGSTRVQQKTLGQDDFFKLLTTQLASQDPLKPMEDTAFIAQMASFSELQMTSDLTTAFDKFTNMQQLAAAQGYLGRKVTFSDGTAGTVTMVESKDDDTLLMLDGKVTGTSFKKVSRVEI